MSKFNDKRLTNRLITLADHFGNNQVNHREIAASSITMSLFLYNISQNLVISPSEKVGERPA